MLVVVALLFCCAFSAPFPHSYQQQATTIISSASLPQFLSFDDYEYVCDTFGPRFVGSQNLESALNWIASEAEKEGLVVHKEPVYNITHWIRGEESLQMLQPRTAKLQLLGLGTSVGGEVTAEVIVVSSFEDLQQNSAKAKGKIVVYDVPFVTYGETVQYRSRGAVEAAKVGALASLIRSVTPFSLYTTHTGVQHYEDGVKPIPTACITVEDSEMLHRMYKRGQQVILHLKMSAKNLPDTSSWNILAEIPGSTSPNEVVVLGGHSDSWDVGQGAIDDGGGFFSALNAVLLIKKLVLAGKLSPPRRTIRAVLWVDEEVNQRGAAAYFSAHQNSLKDHVIAMESDIGNFNPDKFGFTGLPAAMDIMKQIGSVLLAPLGVGNVTDGGADVDNGPLCDAGVPCASLSGTADTSATNYYYFYFHHSNADSITHINREGMKNSVAAFGIVSYVLADWDQRLPSKLLK